MIVIHNIWLSGGTRGGILKNIAEYSRRVFSDRHIQSGN